MHLVSHFSFHKCVTAFQWAYIIHRTSYINTLSDEQQEYLEFNVEFVGAADGTHAILVKTIKDIFAGEELWIDYGKSFTVVGATAEPREVAEEPLRDED